MTAGGGRRRVIRTAFTGAGEAGEAFSDTRFQQHIVGSPLFCLSPSLPNCDHLGGE